MKREYVFLILGFLIAGMIGFLFYKRAINSGNEKIEIKISNHKSEIKDLRKEKDSIKFLYDSIKKIEPEIIKEYVTINKKWDKVRSAPISDVVSDSMLRTVITRGKARFDQ